MKIQSLILLSSISLFAAERPDSNIGLISEAFGHIICKNLDRIDVKFDMCKLVKGIQDAAEGKESPMTETECIEAISLEQAENFQKLSQKNLKMAEVFLDENAKGEGVIVIAEGKVQYRIISQGTGSEVNLGSTPLIRFTVKDLNGTTFGPENQEEPVSLNETFPGLKAGLLGMKEGEKRILYIHPDLSYGEKGPLFFTPNSLLTFEIEILKTESL